MMNSKLLAQSLMKLSQKKDAEKAIESFFLFLQKKNLVSLLPQIKRHLGRELEKTSAQNKLIISSKHTLSDSEIQNIVSLVGADTDIEIEIVKDEALVGGFSAVYQGNIYDGSLKNQITQLKNTLTR